MMAQSPCPELVSMYTLPQQPLQSPINEYHLCQSWSGCDCHATDFSMASMPQEVEIQACRLFDSTEGTTPAFSTATWTTQREAWPTYQQLDFQQPEPTAYSLPHLWPNPVDNPPIPGQDWHYASDFQLQDSPAPGVTATCQTPKTSKGRKMESTSQPPMKKARLIAREHASPTYMASYDANANGTEAADQHKESDHDTCSSPRPEGKKTYRVKNRAAAKRCREKTKQHELDLAAEEQRVTQQRMYLDACVAALKNEVLVLRSQILEHGDCDCEIIRGYIARTANNVSIGLHGERQLV
ncbi:hypothetical protein CFIO01_09920 [Colletotrichum fioriniae PJ7]|uniref:BZIP domain-containing protein n=1 Tax=Colletotrichum fioriniae PJ7 TaxID=1445577 RepID=A0A010SMJ6_9PEZI|nr:hypothetical protein CFIO01_09920 [Colletotrichum fioriniae PJ7]